MREEYMRHKRQERRCTATKIPIMCSFTGNCAASVPISAIRIHVSVSNSYISRIGPHIFLQQNRQTNPGNIEISHRHMNVDIGTVPLVSLCSTCQREKV
jgi:hypothetical protein